MEIIVSSKAIFRAAAGLLLALSAGLMAGCEKNDEGTDAVPGEGKYHTVYIPAEKGTKRVAVTTKGEWNVTFENGSWLTAEPESSRGDGTLVVSHRANNAFPRKDVMFVKSGSVTDTILFKQYGITPNLAFMEKSGTQSAAGGNKSVPFSTNLTPVHISSVTIEAVDGDETAIDWITGIELSGEMDEVFFGISANNTGEQRTGIIRISYKDSWEDLHSGEYTLVQAPAGGTGETREITFAELRSKISGVSGSIAITDDIAITGIIISDHRNPNVAANPNMSATTIDYSVNNKTAYIQSSDGSLGFRMVLDTEEDNILERYDNLRLWLKGAILTKESEPERYTVSELTSQHYITLEHGSAGDAVQKSKFMSELTDDDIYTFVTLKDCEFPLRWGSFTPINEGYGRAYNAYRVDMYPLLMRDINAGSMFMLTNVGCTYRRDGSALPQGSGTVSGIIVHEKFERFEKGGNIGRYQLRHLTREDIAIAQDFSDGFSAMIAEWKGFNRVNNKIMPSVGSGEITHSYSGYTGSAYSSTGYGSAGPITGNQAEDNKGSVSGGAFANAYWWNSDDNSPYGWMVKFSTLGISTPSLSMQLSTVNNEHGVPRYWAAEWSIHGDPAQAWSRIVEYTVPDAPVWGNTLLTQLPGHKNINIDLPVEMLGKETVYVRLVPTANNAGDGNNYDGKPSRTGSVANAISYLGIRYNK